jgi:hypothetical protein
VHLIHLAAVRRKLEDYKKLKIAWFVLLTGCGDMHYILSWK